MRYLGALWYALLVGLLFASGCQRGADVVEMEKVVMLSTPGATSAIAVLHPTGENHARGTIQFKPVEGGIKVSGEISGLQPGPHGFHVHEYGDCSATDATSAGGHYAPRGMPHAAPSDKKRHIGDLGNIVADSNGVAQVRMTDQTISLNGEYSIIGRGIIVHAGADDLKSQPSGAAGARLACGVIGISK